MGHFFDSLQTINIPCRSPQRWSSPRSPSRNTPCRSWNTRPSPGRHRAPHCPQSRRPGRGWRQSQSGRVTQNTARLRSAHTAPRPVLWTIRRRPACLWRPLPRWLLHRPRSVGRRCRPAHHRGRPRLPQSQAAGRSASRHRGGWRCAAKPLCRLKRCRRRRLQRQSRASTPAVCGAFSPAHRRLKSGRRPDGRWPQTIRVLSKRSTPFL